MSDNQPAPNPVVVSFVHSLQRADGYVWGSDGDFNDTWTLICQRPQCDDPTSDFYISVTCGYLYQVHVTGVLNVTGLVDSQGKFPTIFRGYSQLMYLFKVGNGATLRIKHVNISISDIERVGSGKVCFYNDTSSAFDCVYDLVCPAGTIHIGSGMATNATACVSCPLGRYLSDNRIDSSKHDDFEDCQRCSGVTYLSDPSSGQDSEDDCLPCPGGNLFQCKWFYYL